MNGALLIAGAILTVQENLSIDVTFTSGTKLSVNLGVIAGVIMMTVGVLSP